jgi:hypothetical protein
MSRRSLARVIAWLYSSSRRASSVTFVARVYRTTFTEGVVHPGSCSPGGRCTVWTVMATRAQSPSWTELARRQCPVVQSESAGRDMRIGAGGGGPARAVGGHATNRQLPQASTGKNARMTPGSVRSRFLPCFSAAMAQLEHSSRLTEFKDSGSSDTSINDMRRLGGTAPWRRPRPRPIRGGRGQWSPAGRTARAERPAQRKL